MASRWNKAALVGLLVWFVAFFVVAAVYPTIDSKWTVAVVAVSGVVVLCLLSVAAAGMKHKLERHDCCLCLTCQYPLDGQPEKEGKCPECGEYFCKEVVQESWRKRYWPREGDNPLDHS